MGLVIVCGLLAVPAGHQVIGHHVHLKILRAVFHGSHRHGPEVPLTPHEHRHRYKTRLASHLTDAAWLAYIGLALVIGLLLGP